MPSNRHELQALKNMLAEVDLLLSTTVELPEYRTKCCRDLLSTATKLVDDLLSDSRLSPAEALGRKGGLSTSQKRGAEHYRAMAAARKTHAGGRPRKQQS